MNKKTENLFWGLFFILGACFIIFGKLGMFAGINVFSLFFTVFLIAVIVKSIPHWNFGGILFPVAFLCIIYSDTFHLGAITPWTVLFAALLGTIGLSMIFKKKHRHVYYHHDGSFEKSEVFNEQDGSQFRFETTFGSSIKYVNSGDFQSADLDCSFGSMKVYFDNAVVRNGNAVINLDISFAGAELFIPKTWTIINKTSTAFGAIDEKNKSFPDGSTSVTFTGDISFGGVTIYYI